MKHISLEIYISGSFRPRQNGFDRLSLKLTMLHKLPLEQLSTVFSFCDARSVVALSLVSPYLRSCVQSNRIVYEHALNDIFFGLTNSTGSRNMSVAQSLNFIASLGHQVDIEQEVNLLAAEKISKTTIAPFHNDYELHNNVLVNPTATLDNSLYNFTNPITQNDDCLTWLVKDYHYVTLYEMSLRDGFLRVKHRENMENMIDYSGTSVSRSSQMQIGRGHLGHYYATNDTQIFQDQLWIRKKENHVIKSIMLPIGYNLPGVGVQKLQSRVNSRYSYCRLDSKDDSAWFLLDWNQAKSFLLFKTDKYSDKIDLHACAETGCVFITSNTSLNTLKLFPRISEREITWYTAQTNDLPKSYLSLQYGCVVREGAEVTYLKHKGSILLVGQVEGTTQCWKFTRPFLSKLDAYVKRCLPVWKADSEEWRDWKMDLSGYFYPQRRRTR
ncbi:hypothetical protein B0I72DRAFT_108031 [Yarrowia lipolytica]|jgi:hypothetical protein|uniref:YALI0E09559p n=2 Tax=Yarrowia lipolytica TaxID=4952 RepID=Q6C6H3_YARLI|nr:YALI0E09559p [Yarrowia lipolytica CLIB122]AOW05181.1 hypothetical protein YALI1_E11835g [Yarrowia lipolytica]KAE8173419.1 hypothetical protein BKA90DRAFT_109934 [Yarrowia lipolytica]KAJ8056721.1 hypothetical protein LXG23DRAFT_16382 [Yarrowia lipolytica]RDW34617.1 hypothetical protein B0I72DRAFT_108031 [Yarrowia lipolytica]RDW40179.1 hypothetical protein B0I73DRAFT_164595 [Yarrowia lipolytica]|eukprot:XP_503739.1 YALI0E09559p [Yarrowia lipolytica CLIB122]